MLTLLTAPNYSQQLSIMFAVCGERVVVLYCILTTTHMLLLTLVLALGGCEISTPVRGDRGGKFWAT